jgi:hypothetical protein
MLSLEEKRSPRLLRRKAPDPNIGSHLPPPPGAALPLSTSPQLPLESADVSPHRDNVGRQSVGGGVGNVGGARLSGAVGGDGGALGGGMVMMGAVGGGAVVPYDPRQLNSAMNTDGGGAPTYFLNFQDAVAHMNLMGDGMYTSSSPRDAHPSKPLEYEPIPVERIFHQHHQGGMATYPAAAGAQSHRGPEGGRAASRGSHLALPLLPSDPRMMHQQQRQLVAVHDQPRYPSYMLPQPPLLDLPAAQQLMHAHATHLNGLMQRQGLANPPVVGGDFGYGEDMAQRLAACNRIAERQLDALDLWFAALQGQQSRATTQGGSHHGNHLGGGGWSQQPSAAGARPSMAYGAHPELPAKSKFVQSPRSVAAALPR